MSYILLQLMRGFYLGRAKVRWQRANLFEGDANGGRGWINYCESVRTVEDEEVAWMQVVVKAAVN